MNADAFRQYYDYHLAEKRKIWKAYVVPLKQEQFLQKVDYSMGSVRNQMVHLMSVDEAWFSGLRNVEPEFLEDSDDRDAIRAHWDKVEQHMRDYLATLTDEMLFQKPFPEGEDVARILW